MRRSAQNARTISAGDQTNPTAVQESLAHAAGPAGWTLADGARCGRRHLTVAASALQPSAAAGILCQRLISKVRMATNVHLTPELDSFARSCVESGQYNSVSEVVRAALRLLQDLEAQRLQLQRLVAEGYASARDEGTVSAEDALRHGRGDR